MGLANKLTLFLTASGVSAAAVYALSAFARSHRTGELRKMAEDVRGKAEEQSVPVEPDPAPERAVDPPSQDAALNRVLEEGTTLEELEKAYILLVLDHAEGNRSRAADILNISRRTLYRKMRDYGIAEEEEEEE